MADTFVKIASVTVGSGGASSIDFTSIPSTYTDLCLKISAKDNRSTTSYETQFALTFNGSGSSYSIRRLYGQSGSAASDSGANSNIYSWNTGTTNATNVCGSSDIYIPNYAGSNYKSFSADAVTEGNSSTGPLLAFNAGLWSNTAAITSISLSSGYTILQYSTATLYGIKNS